MYHSQPWFNLNVPWPARVYKICNLEFGFEVRWFHGTYVIYTTLVWEFKGASQCLIHILPGQYHGAFANDFDTLPVQRNDAL